MKSVRLGIETLAVPGVILKARTLVSRIDGNKHFTSPNPSLEEISAAATALENAYEDAKDGSKVQKIALRQCTSVLIGLIKSLGAYVQSVSAGEEDIIASSGFDIRRQRTAPLPTDTPGSVRGRATEHPGEIVLRWAAAAGAKSYIAQMSTDGANWTICGVSTKTRLVVSGLPEGSKAFFRVSAIGTLGQSGWSDPGAVRVD